jgi:hypothetical protein
VEDEEGRAAYGYGLGVVAPAREDPHVVLERVLAEVAFKPPPRRATTSVRSSRHELEVKIMQVEVEAVVSYR